MHTGHKYRIHVHERHTCVHVGYMCIPYTCACRTHAWIHVHAGNMLEGYVYMQDMHEGYLYMQDMHEGYLYMQDMHAGHLNMQDRLV